MSAASLIFWTIFVVPLVGFLIWVMRQDKKKGSIGLLVLVLVVVLGIIYMYARTDGQ